MISQNIIPPPHQKNQMYLCLLFDPSDMMFVFFILIVEKQCPLVSA